MDLVSEWNKIANAEPGSAARHFGDPHAQFEAARSSAIVTPVTQFALLRIHGSDAQAFLQGQLTCNLDEVTLEQAQFGGYCTPKGRLLANFLLVVTPSGFLMELSADIANDIVDRLRKFVMRARVTIEPENGWRMLGVAGPAAPALLEAEPADPASGRLPVVKQGGAVIVRLRGNHFLVMSPSEDMPALWDKLAQRAQPVGADCWNWVQIRSGVPWITAPTQDQFLPQMIGLDAIGGVSFDKGCFPGQEIVARSRYLGEVKRKLRLGHARGTLHAGDALFSAGQRCATVLNAAPLPEGGSDFLAVVGEQAADQTTQTAEGEIVLWPESARSS
jgi:folate-binding protein YgfZ